MALRKKGNGTTPSGAPTTTRGLQPPHNETRSADELRNLATRRRRKIKREIAAEEPPRTNLIEEAAYRFIARSLWLQPSELHHRDKRRYAKPDLARETWLQSFDAGLIRRDARLSQPRLHHRLPPAVRSLTETSHGAADLAAETRRPTLRRHGARASRSKTNPTATIYRPGNASSSTPSSSAAGGERGARRQRGGEVEDDSQNESGGRYGHSR